MVELVRRAERNIPAAVRRAVIARDGMVCQLCREAVTPQTMHLDHIKHWADGGENVVENLRVTCAPCNLRRPGPLYVIRRLAPDDAPDYVRLNDSTRRRLARRRMGAAFRISMDDPEVRRLIAEAPKTARQRREGIW